MRVCVWRPLPCEVVRQAAHQLAHAVLAGAQLTALQVHQEVVPGRRVERHRLVCATRQTQARQLVGQSESREREAVRHVAEKHDYFNVFLITVIPIRNT